MTEFKASGSVTLEIDNLSQTGDDVAHEVERSLGSVTIPGGGGGGGRGGRQGRRIRQMARAARDQVDELGVQTGLLEDIVELLDDGVGGGGGGGGGGILSDIIPFGAGAAVGGGGLLGKILGGGKSILGGLAAGGRGLLGGLLSGARGLGGLLKKGLTAPPAITNFLFQQLKQHLPDLFEKLFGGGGGDTVAAMSSQLADSLNLDFDLDIAGMIEDAARQWIDRNFGGGGGDGDTSTKTKSKGPGTKTKSKGGVGKSKLSSTPGAGRSPFEVRNRIRDRVPRSPYESGRTFRPGDGGGPDITINAPIRVEQGSDFGRELERRLEQAKREALREVENEIKRRGMDRLMSREQDRRFQRGF